MNSNLLIAIDTCESIKPKFLQLIADNLAASKILRKKGVYSPMNFEKYRLPSFKITVSA